MQSPALGYDWSMTVTIRPPVFVAVQWTLIFIAVSSMALGHALFALIIFLLGLLFTVSWLNSRGKPPKGW